MEQNSIFQLIDTLKNTPYTTKQNLSLLITPGAENLNYWVKRLVTIGELIPLKNGMYVPKKFMESLQNQPNKKQLLMCYLGNNLREPSYISLEYVLSQANIIPESVFAITSVTLKSSRTYDTPLATFNYRSIKESLFNGFEEQEFNGKLVKTATPGKALFDFLYFKKFTNTLDQSQYLESEGRFNWEALNEKDKALFKQAVEMSNSKKMNQLLKILTKKGIL